jgi:membrane-bound lytic murein transglycosylase B
LDAYRRASAAVSGRGCPLPWWAVAGIGKVESNHGRSHGTQLGANGDLDPPILGPALDGSNGTQAVPATDGGRLTGDPMWDHAVGPLQFIPSTWRRWGRNGNPNNIYDASLAAATYLCAAVPDVTTDAGLAAAFHAYNHSDGYVAEVLAYAHAYAGR